MSVVMRGLNVFISDLRNAQSREEEEKRVNKEIANIRSKFKDGKLNSYDKKKYVCKMLYMYILGWELDFGHVEAYNLITGNKYTEKQIGYLAASLMLSENSDLIRIVVNSMKNDLTNYNEVSNCLALATIANIGGREMAEALYPDVYRLLVSDGGSPFVKKKAALCLLRMYRKTPDTLPVVDWAKNIIPLIDDADLGVSSSVVTLVTAFATQFPQEYAGGVQRAIDKLDALLQGNCRADYEYYRIPSPWLQVKCLRLLQCYPPIENPNQLAAIKSVLNRIISKATDNVKPGNYANALNAIILEAINLAIHLDPESETVIRSIGLLGSFLTHKETNFRYLGLQAMATLALAVESLDPIKRHTDAVLQSLRDRDISVRRSALDLLYCMCDSGNARRIVQELLQYLAVADFAIREELVLKIAILAERFATDYAWYVDVILQLIGTAGDFVSDDVWYRVIQIVVNNPDLQKYAALTTLNALRSPNWHETAVKVAGYILGEFGDLIANEPGCAPIDQFAALHSKFGTCSVPTKALLFTTYIKLVNLFPEIREEVISVLKQYDDVLDVEMQQRACEYLAIIQSSNAGLLESVCEEMPPFPEKEESSLVSLVQKKETETTDKVLRMRPKSKNPQRKGSFSAGSYTATQTSAAAAAAALASAQQPRPTSLTPPQPLPQAAPVTAAAPMISAAPVKPRNELEDLLGLNIGGSSAPATGGFGGSAVADTGLTPGYEKGYNKLLLANDGVLFENEVVQIGLKTEYRASAGRIAIFFGNKSATPLTSFTSNVTFQGQALKLQVQPIANTLAAQAQVQQGVAVECLGEFADAPAFTVSFAVAGGPPRRLNLLLPVVLTKFMDPIQLGSDDFFGRWKQIGGAPKESLRDLKVPIDLAKIRAVLTGLRLSVLDGIDPNPSNFVSAGIFITTTAKIGSLVRVQTSAADQAIRVTVRTTNPAVSEVIVNLISKQITS